MEWRNERGQLHRTDGPALIRANGVQAWCLNGERHRTDGPAYISTDGSQAWYLNDLLHRTDGPAIIRADGSEEWYLHGRELTQFEHWILVSAREVA